MPTHHDETLLERYQREHRVYERMNMSKHTGNPATVAATCLLASQEKPNERNQMNTKPNVVAYEFFNETTGHAIVDYTENTHAGQFTARNGYIARPLVYADEAMVVSLLALDAKAVEALMTAIGAKAVSNPSEVEKLMDAAGLCRRCAAPQELPENTSERDRLSAINAELLEALKGCHSTLKILGDASDNDVSPFVWRDSGAEASELTALNLILENDRAAIAKAQGEQP